MSIYPRSISLKINVMGSLKREIHGIPWFPGVRVIDALIMADGFLEDDFIFRAIYGSEYGVFIDMIDGIVDSSNENWMLYLNGVLVDSGASETLIPLPQVNSDTMIEWRYEDVSKIKHNILKQRLANRMI